MGLRTVNGSQSVLFVLPSMSVQVSNSGPQAWWPVLGSLDHLTVLGFLFQELQRGLLRWPRDNLDLHKKLDALDMMKLYCTHI